MNGLIVQAPCLSKESGVLCFRNVLELNTMTKMIHRKIMVLTLISTLFTFLFPTAAFCEIKTVTHTVKQAFGGSQSPDDARIAAVAKAKREALEMAGVYVEALTIVKNAKVDKDEILALTAGVLQAQVISQKNYASEDAFGIDVVVKVVVDTSVLEERVKKLLQDRTHLDQLNQARAREKELLKEIAVLEGENKKSGKSDQKQASLKKEFQEASRGITVVDWVDKAIALWIDGKFTDPQKAIGYLTNAIHLQPDLALAYNNRGVAYANLGHHQRAIEDHNEAIRLQPDDALAYNNRGGAYKDLGRYQRAIEDYNEAIRLRPDYADAYRNRGIVYTNLGHHQRAIGDYNEAIRLRPDYALAYINRGSAYRDLGRYQRAIEDYNEAIRIQPDDAVAYGLRGIAYKDLGRYQRAIEDYNEAIRLRPNNTDVYGLRGIAYFSQGNNTLHCRDAEKACALGDCRLLELAKRNGNCR